MTIYLRVIPSDDSVFQVMFRTLASLAIFSIFAVVAGAQVASVKPAKVMRIRGSILSVEDSDRVKVATDDGNVYAATLQSIDAPDQKQEYFKKAKKRLADLVEGKEVTVMLRTSETGESYAVVYAGADDVGLKLIEEGLAWFAPNRSASQSAADREKYLRAESAAKSTKTGLWNDKGAVAPWTFRGETLQPPAAETTEASVNVEMPKRSQPVPGRTYILGPRGGCYYLNDQGIKVYVKDKTLCQKQ